MFNFILFTSQPLFVPSSKVFLRALHTIAANHIRLPGSSTLPTFLTKQSRFPFLHVCYCPHLRGLKLRILAPRALLPCTSPSKIHRHTFPQNNSELFWENARLALSWMAEGAAKMMTHLRSKMTYDYPKSMKKETNCTVADSVFIALEAIFTSTISLLSELICLVMGIQNAAIALSFISGVTSWRNMRRRGEIKA